MYIKWYTNAKAAGLCPLIEFHVPNALIMPVEIALQRMELDFTITVASWQNGSKECSKWRVKDLLFQYRIITSKVTRLCVKRGTALPCVLGKLMLLVLCY